jgi:4-hydroxy-tetrahydrodipicolinate reductase
MRTTSPHSLGVVGASGRLGASIVALARQRGVAVPLLASRRAGWMSERRPEVVINAAPAAALADVITYCDREAVAMVCASSNLSVADEGALAELGLRVPVVRASNLSFGHYLQTEALAAVARCVAQHIEADDFVNPVEARVVERHPAHKADRPSATALRLAALWGQHGGAAKIEALRHGLAVSDHQIGWAFEGEELVIDHRVVDRAAAARGALRAAAWLVGRPAGLFEMAEVYQ